MKCSACDDGFCRGLNENWIQCIGKKEDISCACKCQVTKITDAVTKASSLISGAACIGGAIFIGGLAPPVQGLLIGMGTSLTSNPIRKEISGEYLDFCEPLAEALTFGANGASIGSGVGLLNEAESTTDTLIGLVVLSVAALSSIVCLKKK